MSRRAGYSVLVAEGDDGTPAAIFQADGEKVSLHPPTLSRGFRPTSHPQPILSILAHHREWIGVLDGEPERDVWLVETPDGICELHRSRPRARRR